jgi:hypothetical protein
MIDVDAALGEQFLDVAVRQLEAQVPADRPHDHIRRKAETGKGRPCNGIGADAASSHDTSLAARVCSQQMQQRHPDEPIAVKRAMEQFRWFTGGWRINAELPVPASFEVASRTVREEDVAAKMPCGPDLERHLAGIRQFLASVQVGGDTQEQFISWAATQLLPALRAS